MFGMLKPQLQPVSAKTAAYTVLVTDLGTFFTTRGNGGSLTFTLPATSGLPTGWWCEFFNAAAQTMVVTSSGSSDDLTTFNDLTADSITFSTSSELIGASVKVLWDGTGWCCQLMTEETQTATIA